MPFAASFTLLLTTNAIPIFTPNVWTCYKTRVSGLKTRNFRYSLYDSGLIDFLKEKYQFPETIIIFGSYSKGEDTEKSDIDIAVITRLEKNLDFSLFEKKLQRKINLLELKNLEKAKKEFINNLINGIVLDGVIQI